MTKIIRESIRGLRGHLEAPDRHVTLRRAKRASDSALMWQIETKVLGMPGTDQVMTISDEALTAIFDLRHLLNREPAELVAILERRKGRTSAGDPFMPVTAETPAAAAHASTAGWEVMQ